MADEQIKCTDCPNEFTFTQGEQDFYSSKGLSKPKRCKPCREKRKNSLPRNQEQSEAPREQPSRGQWTNGDDSQARDRNRRSNNNRPRRDRGHDDY